MRYGSWYVALNGSALVEDALAHPDWPLEGRTAQDSARTRSRPPLLHKLLASVPSHRIASLQKAALDAGTRSRWRLCGGKATDTIVHGLAKHAWAIRHGKADATNLFAKLGSKDYHTACISQDLNEQRRQYRGRGEGERSSHGAGDHV